MARTGKATRVATRQGTSGKGFTEWNELLSDVLLFPTGEVIEDFSTEDEPEVGRKRSTVNGYIVRAKSFGFHAGIASTEKVSTDTDAKGKPKAGNDLVTMYVTTIRGSGAKALAEAKAGKLTLSGEATMVASLLAIADELADADAEAGKPLREALVAITEASENADAKALAKAITEAALLAKAITEAGENG